MPFTLDQNRLDYSKYFAWDDGNLTTLYNIPANQVNGLALVGVEELSTRFNYFGAISRFFTDAMLGDVPAEAMPYFPFLETLVRHWAVVGEYCVTIDNGVPTPVRPDFVFPLADVADFSIMRGYLLVFPLLDERNQLNGFARVVEFNSETGTATENIREYYPGVVGNVNQTVGQSTITDVMLTRTGDGVYKDVEGIVRELNVRMAMLQSALNSTAFPILQIAVDGLQGVTGQRDVTTDLVKRNAKTGLGLTVPPPFTGEAEPRYVERSGAGLTEALEYVRLLLGQLSVVSGVPDYVYGVSLNQNPTEVERILFAGQAKVTRLRRAIEETFANLGIDVHFGTEPFTTRKQRVENIIKLFTDGLITQDEAREAIGFPAIGNQAVFAAIGQAAMGMSGNGDV